MGGDGTNPADAPLGAADAREALETVAKVAGVDLYAEGFPTPTGVPEDMAWEEFGGWTVGSVRQVLDEVARRGGREAVELYGQALSAAAVDLKVAKVINRRLQQEVGRHRRGRLLPEGDMLDRISRYEGGLERSFLRLLHEYQRLRAARQGRPTVPPLAVDVDLGGGA